MAILRACMLYAVCSLLHFTTANAQVIYYPGNASVLLQKTAADMASLLQQSMAGSVFTTQEAGTALPSLGISLVYDSSISPNEACHVKKMDNGLLQFSAAEDNGLVAGIYRYLYQLGFRFYLPGELWQKIPVLSSAFISIDTVYKSEFKYRNWFISGGYRTWIMDSSAAYNWNGSYNGANGFAWSQFMRRNFMTGAYRFQGHRGDIMNTAYYSILQNNPCYVASFNGSRTASKSSVPNVANTAAMQAWATAIEDVFTQKRNAIVGNSMLYKDQFRSLQYNYSNIGIEVPDGPRWATGTDNSACDKVNMSASNQAAIFIIPRLLRLPAIFHNNICRYMPILPMPIHRMLHWAIIPILMYKCLRLIKPKPVPLACLIAGMAFIKMFRNTITSIWVFGAAKLPILILMNLHLRQPG